MLPWSTSRSGRAFRRPVRHRPLPKPRRPEPVWDLPADRRVAELLGLTNVVDGIVTGEVADTPWGALPVPGAADGPIAVLVQPGGVVVDPSPRKRASA